MMRMFINALAASAGGGLTYMRNVLPLLASRPDICVTTAMSPQLRQEFHELTNVSFQELELSAARRFWHEQSSLPGLIRKCRSDVLISTGNFALRKSPVPQILLSRNSLYMSTDFYRDLLSRHEYRSWLDTRLKAMVAKRSIYWADVTVAPTAAFASEISRWSGRQVVAIHHGFDPETFTRNTAPLPAEIENKLTGAEGSLKLLFVSHYNYYRNFETLIRSLPLLRDRLGGRSLKLLLTCHLGAGKNPGTYHAESAGNLVESLRVSDMVLELGAIPYHQLHRIYRRADVYVTPAYAETFAHPLVEAMASGVPVVASDIAVHREICGDAATYFARFSPQDLAETLSQVLQSQEVSARMAASGLERSREFSWKKHVDQLCEVSSQLIDSVPSTIAM